MLDTGYSDDAIALANGTLKFAIAAFNGVDCEQQSVSEPLVLKTDTAP